MVGRALGFACLLALAACGPAAAPDSGPEPEAAEQIGEAEPLPQDPLPPPRAARYVGRWAAVQRACADPAWTFRPNGLSTAGEVSCAFEAVDEIPGGYRIAADCQSEGQRSTTQLQLTFAESAEAMLVDGGPFARSVALVYCGPLQAEP